MKFLKQLLQVLNSIHHELQERNRILRLVHNIYEDRAVMTVPTESQQAPDNLENLPVIKFIPKGDRIQTEPPTVGHPYSKS